MDDASRLGRGVPHVDGPRANLFFPGGEIRSQTEQMIGRADERADARFGDAEFLEEFFGLLSGQINQVALNLRADDHGFAGEMRLHIVADLEDIGVLVGGGEIGLLDVAGENSRLVITGDLDQHDRPNELNGLEDFLEKFRGKRSSSIGSFEFDRSDIQREEVVKEILDIYGGEVPPNYLLPEDQPDGDYDP